MISIHAPARGATIGHTLHAVSEQFQSTPPRGERPYFSDSRLFAVPFQSTPPRGERRMISSCVSVFFVISIHAPARGATPYLFRQAK